MFLVKSCITPVNDKMKSGNQVLRFYFQNGPGSQIIQSGASLGGTIETSYFRIMLDDQTLAVTNSLADAVCVLIATFYVFNIAYSAPLAKTLEFISNKCSQDGYKDGSRNKDLTTSYVVNELKLILWCSEALIMV